MSEPLTPEAVSLMAARADCADVDDLVRDWRRLYAELQDMKILEAKYADAIKSLSANAEVYRRELEHISFIGCYHCSEGAHAALAAGKAP